MLLFSCLFVICSSGLHWRPLIKVNLLPSASNFPGLAGDLKWITRDSSMLWSRSVGDDMNWDPKMGPKLDFDEDYYSVLEVEPNIDPKKLKKAYYKIVFKYHPDNKETEEAKSLCNKQMMVINNAYKCLKDPGNRAAYDKKRQMAKGSSQSSNVAGAAPQQPRSSSSQSRRPQEPGSTRAEYREVRVGDEGAYYADNYYGDDIPPVDSLADIVTEMWSTISRDGGKRLLEDVLEFLEDQMPSAAVGDVDGKAGRRSISEINTEMNVLRTALNRLQAHLEEMKTTRKAQEVSILGGSRKIQISGFTDTAELEKRLNAIEEIKAMDARIAEVVRQEKNLQQRLRDCIDQLRLVERAARDGGANETKYYGEQEEFSGRRAGTGGTVRGSREYSDATATSSTRQSSPSSNKERVVSRMSDSSLIVESELQKLKKKLGMT